MATEKRLIDANALKETVTTDYYEHFTRYHDTDQIALIDMVCDDIEEAPTVDAVEVDKFNVRLHHILIDNEGVPEVKLQIGDKYFILHTDPVDVAEVVHGEWSTIEDDYLGLIVLQCSKCNQEYWFEDEPPMKIYNYCPNCGADMRERKDNE